MSFQPNFVDTHVHGIDSGDVLAQQLLSTWARVSKAQRVLAGFLSNTCRATHRMPLPGRGFRAVIVENPTKVAAALHAPRNTIN